MAWSFRSTSFDAEIEKTHPGLIFPGRTREPARHQIVGANRQAVQIPDLPNKRIVLLAWRQGDATPLATWEALLDGTSGTLSGVPTWGGGTTSLSNMVLTQAETPDDAPNLRGYVGATQIAPVRLTFDQVA